MPDTFTARFLPPGPPPPPVSFRPTPGEIRVFRSRGALTISQWADKYRIVTEGSTKGVWQTDKTPYTRGPMDALSLPYVRGVILCWAPQTGKTQIALNAIGYWADTDPGPVMAILPNEKKALAYNRNKITKLLTSSTRLSELITERRADLNRYEITLSNNMKISTVWASSAAELSEVSIRYIILDETDKYDEFTGREADPVSLAQERLNSFPYDSKEIYISTPSTQEGIIWRLMNKEADEIRDYWVPCPICHTFQVMKFEQLTWPASVTDYREIRRNRLASYICESCGMKWDDLMRDLAVLSGEWRPRIPVTRPVYIAFHLPSWYSPFISLSKPVRDYLRAKEDPTKMMAFVTQNKAEAYSETIEATEESELLSHKTNYPAGVVPESALALTCGIDSHKWGYRFVVRAWDEDMTSYKIQHGTASTKQDVEDLVFSVRYPVVDVNGAPTGQTMGIWRAAIDTGGSEAEGSDDLTLTEDIYQFVRDMQRKYPRHYQHLSGGLFAVKGASHAQAMRVKYSTIDKFPHSGKPIPGGLRIRTLDTASYKLLIHNRLSRGEGEPQRFLIDADTGMDYIREVLSEELIQTRRGRQIWKKIRSANHALDAEVYATACADSEWFHSFKTLMPLIKMDRNKSIDVAAAASSARRVISPGAGTTGATDTDRRIFNRGLH